MYRPMDYRKIYEQEEKSTPKQPTSKEKEKIKKATKSGTTFALPIDATTKDELIKISTQGSGTWQSKTPLKKFVDGREGEAVMINGKPVYLQIRAFSSKNERTTLPVSKPNESQIFVTWDTSAENLSKIIIGASDITNAYKVIVKLLDEVHKGNSPEFSLLVWSDDETKPVEEKPEEKQVEVKEPQKEEQPETEEPAKVTAAELTPGTA